MKVERNDGFMNTAGAETMQIDDYFKKAIKEMPKIVVADVAPVRHGRWELYGNDDDLSASFFCSLCGWNMDENEYLDIWRHLKYCPNCGAKMDEVRE